MYGLARWFPALFGMLALLPHPVEAQRYAGFRGGVALANVTGSLFGLEGRRGLTASLFGRTHLSSRWAVQAELGWVQKGTREKVGSDGSINLNVDYLQVPLLLQYVLSEDDRSAQFYIGAVYNRLGSCTLGANTPTGSFAVDCGEVNTVNVSITAAESDLGGLFGASFERVADRFVWLVDVRMEVGGADAIIARTNGESEGSRHFHVAGSVGVAVPLGR